MTTRCNHRLLSLFLKKTTLFIMLLLIYHNAFTATANPDSLVQQWEQLKHADDTVAKEKVSLLLKLSRELRHHFPDSAMNYNKQAITIAGKHGLTNQIAEARSYLGGIYDIKGEYQFAMEEFTGGVKPVGTKQKPKGNCHLIKQYRTH
ncbi:MAG: hypothetical protein U5L09_20880 [Bacteroidales bacterium]|nr:hypothetical protein [Bacteroidales bacterium]